MDLRLLGSRARTASIQLATAAPSVKNRFLACAADSLMSSVVEIVRANDLDMKQGQSRGLSSAMLDRLRLDQERIAGMAGSLKELIELPDPVGGIEGVQRRPNGLLVGRQRIPLGVIGIIYEARPNVTSDAASLCVKSGNAVLLKGGSEAFHSNMAIAEILRKALKESGLPEDAIQLIPSVDRDVVRQLIQLTDYLDLVIPRGGEGLIRYVTENARVPVVQHFKGVCHVYVHAEADLEKARNIAVNAKTQRPGVCNAAETLLVDASVASEFLPKVSQSLMDMKVELRGCPRTVELVPSAKPAVDADWHEEYLDLILSVRVVRDFEEALQHISEYGSQHTEAIITESEQTARQFRDRVQSSCVVINASTRFNDGNQLGLGAEIGISTTKLHAFGPMGLEELTTRKFVVQGTGQVRQ